MYIFIVRDNWKGNYEGEAMFDVQAFGEQILLRRRRLKWSQRQLADESGLSMVTIGRIERGEIQNLSVDSMLRIAAALGVSVQALLVGQEDIEEQFEPADAALAGT